MTDNWNNNRKEFMTIWINSCLGLLYPRSEARNTIFLSIQVENSLKPEEHNIKLN